MEWIICLETLLEEVETHLEGELDVSTLARRVYSSPAALERSFRLTTGYSLGEYIRDRRLYEAGLRLKHTAEPVIDIAARYGYESPESFARAFARFHGATPSQVRRDARRLRPFLPLKIHVEITGGNKMDYLVEKMEGFRVIGWKRRFAGETAYRDIPAFWDEVKAAYRTEALMAGAAPETPQEEAVVRCGVGEYAVCMDGIADGQFDYMIAGRYDGGPVPEGMEVAQLPAGEWAKFRCVGPLPDTLQGLNSQIFGEWLPGNPEFELASAWNLEWYSEGATTDPDYESGVWLPVKRK